MKETILIIQSKDIEKVNTLFKDLDINFRLAGYPDGVATLNETFQSSINKIKEPVKKEIKERYVKTDFNNHDDMVSFAKSKGYKDIPDAINGYKSGRNFRNAFKESIK